MIRFHRFMRVLPALLLLPAAAVAGPVRFVQTNLVSDGAVPAAHIDPDLKNPWGLSFSATSPFWVADNGTAKSTLYNGLGEKQGLVVSIVPAPGSASGAMPTGTVFNGVGANFAGDRFLFATLDGTIAGWQPALGTTAINRVDSSATGAVYTGLALSGDHIYAANFASGNIDAFDSGYSPTLSSFTDPTLPAGYSPFNIQEIGGDLYVAYAKVSATGEEEAGLGLGFVDMFDPNGVLIRRLVSGGPLNAPWGLAIAPSGFGNFGGDLLVGNFGDGRIHVFDPITGAYIDTLRDQFDNPIVIDGLWALAFRTGGTGVDLNSLYFTAGPNDEANGLFGSLHAVPEPATSVLIGCGFLALLARRRRMSLG